MSKADNMLSILWLLKSGKQMTARQLADELEIHIRTVYRCIDSLCASGVPIVADSGHHGGYRILQSFTEAPLLFDMDEQTALMHASVFAREAGYPHNQALERAIEKLKRYTTEDQLRHLERHSGGLSVIHPQAAAAQRPMLQQLERAVAEERIVEMSYTKEREAAPQMRRIDPYGIVYWKGIWYMVGHCHLRRSIRSFRVDRIHSLSLTEERFERPAGFSASEFLMGNLLPRSAGPEETAVVTITGPEQALNDLCQHWMLGHALEERSPEMARFKLGTQALKTYVPYFLLPYGKALTIAEPAWLVERMAGIAAGLAEHYGRMNGAGTAGE